MRGTITDMAGKALSALIHMNDATMAEFGNAPNILLPLIDALRAAPALAARSYATHMLHMRANAHPEECVAMAEAGVVGLVLALYQDIWSSPPDGWNLPFAKDLAGTAATLVHVLLESGTGAADDLRQAICSPQTVDAYMALLLVQVCCPWSHPRKPVKIIVRARLCSANRRRSRRAWPETQLPSFLLCLP
jgi:hypothetical protein